MKHLLLTTIAAVLLVAGGVEPRSRGGQDLLQPGDVLDADRHPTLRSAPAAFLELVEQGPQLPTFFRSFGVKVRRFTRIRRQVVELARRLRLGFGEGVLLHDSPGVVVST